jgi:hypothetical protein
LLVTPTIGIGVLRDDLGVACLQNKQKAFPLASIRTKTIPLRIEIHTKKKKTVARPLTISGVKARGL